MTDSIPFKPERDLVIARRDGLLKTRKSRSEILIDGTWTSKFHHWK